MNIITPSTSMRSKPNVDSLLETECLYGESIEILEKYSDWIFCILKTDQYHGWVKNDSVGVLEKPSHRVIVKRTFVLENPNSKSNYFFYLPMGAQVAVNELRSKWAKVYITIKGRKRIGFIPSNHLVRVNDKVKDWVLYAENLIGTPYRWGGRDTIGIDCSALLQLSYQTSGRDIPRNTSQQIKMCKKTIQNINELKRGHVIFWEGHVGIMTDQKNCIHSNAFYMKTTIEPLVNISSRNENDIIKMLNFNN